MGSKSQPGYFDLIRMVCYACQIMEYGGARCWKDKLSSLGPTELLGVLGRVGKATVGSSKLHARRG